ncbi:MAG: carboxymuconolactone decarboxylase family protein [Bacteroidota bacterium]
MARISIKKFEDLPESMRPLWARMQAYGSFENMAGAMAHRRPIFEHIWNLLIDLGQEAVISKRHLYLLMVTASQLNKCAYCVSHDGPKLAAHGLSEEGVARLLDYKDHPELDEVDKLVVEYAIAVTKDWSRTRDDIFRRLRQHFSEAQIVELTWRTALTGAFNRFNDILQIEAEPYGEGKVAAE